jgi:hypothetical protein
VGVRGDALQEVRRRGTSRRAPPATRRAAPRCRCASPGSSRGSLLVPRVPVEEASHAPSAPSRSVLPTGDIPLSTGGTRRSPGEDGQGERERGSEPSVRRSMAGHQDGGTAGRPDGRRHPRPVTTIIPSRSPALPVHFSSRDDLADRRPRDPCRAGLLVAARRSEAKKKRTGSAGGREMNCPRVRSMGQSIQAVTCGGCGAARPAVLPSGCPRMDRRGQRRGERERNIGGCLA